MQVSESQVGRAVRTRRWKYGVVAPDRNGREEPASDRYAETYLYDLLSDPYELDNLAGLESHREVSRVMGKRLVRRMVEAGKAEPIIDRAPERPGGHLRVSDDEARLTCRCWAETLVTWICQRPCSEEDPYDQDSLCRSG